MIRRVLVANRGEIAVRVIRACRDLGIESVAVYTDLDRDAPHAWLADRAEPIGAPGAYLDPGGIVEAAIRSGADAVHPGYGFLAEDPAFADAVQRVGLVFVGPPPETIAALGDKVRAREIARAAGVPVVPGYGDHGASNAILIEQAAALGFPVLVKAASGGGGRGMRIVRDPADLGGALESARREVRAAFGSDDLLLERYLEPARHIEIQIVGDARGTVAHLFERECSVQRRHQKVIEEAPSPALGPLVRREMAEAALALARAVQYRNAGTVEFLLDDGGRFYFLEANTRIQVEHPVTEAVTGVDLVREQIRVASGLPLSFSQDDVAPRGHSIEARLYAEDPEQGFAPSVGRLLRLHWPDGPGVRVDAGVGDGQEVTTQYDPLLAKVVVWDRTRPEAIERMLGALRQTVLLGPRTNVAFLHDAISSEAFRRGETTTAFVERFLAGWSRAGEDELAAAVAAAIGLAREGPAAPAPTVAQDPWDRLGSWRVGG